MTTVVLGVPRGHPATTRTVVRGGVACDRTGELFMQPHNLMYYRNLGS